MSTEVVGRVAGLFRYPVKSMAAEPLDTVAVGWNGFAGDRRWAFIRDGQLRSNFPWLTGRERSDLLLHRPRFTSAEDPERSSVLVTAPDGAELDVTDPVLAERLGAGVRLIKQNRGVFDAAPLSLISTQTVATLGGLAGREVTPVRFRPNLLIDAGSAEAFTEEDWVGTTLAIGGFRMRIDQRDARCAMVNIDPVSAERDPGVLRTIAQERQACLGVYGTTVEPGAVAIGDPVSLEAAG
jgi:hypothetical protein